MIASTTGAPMALRDHIQQSIRDILTTRRGERVMRPDYGSDLSGLIDAPMNDDFFIRAAAATMAALAQFEPRIAIQSVGVFAENGALRLVLAAKVLREADAQATFEVAL